jgi:hypothetical protein
MIIADVNGNFILKRLNNRFFIKNLLNFKALSHLSSIIKSIKVNNKRKMKKIYILFICTEDDGDFVSWNVIGIK